KRRPTAIPGSVPAPHALPSGSAFAPRCPEARELCGAAPPPLVDVPGAPGRRAACARLDDLVARVPERIGA
ncbi:MAG: oligopeptide ABC transporter ATP-binding protein OppD, partial [Pseudomonadota bacterium]